MPNTPRKGQQKGQQRRAELRLGMADFVAASTPNPHAQLQYLRAVGECVPEAFRELTALGADDEAGLVTWAQRRGFTDQWALSFARLHAPFWREHPDLIGRGMITVTSFWKPASPEAPSWDPIVETEAGFNTRVAAYKESVKTAPDVMQAPLKRADRHFRWLALYQVARLTYAKIAENHDDGALDISSISQAVTGAADLVGLTLRRTRGRTSGRKRKS